MFFFIHKGGDLMNVKGMSFYEAAEVLKQMRLETEANNRSDQTAALDIALYCIENWQHYQNSVEDDLK